MRFAAASVLFLLGSSFLIPAASAGQFARPRSKAQTGQKFAKIYTNSAATLQSHVSVFQYPKWKQHTDGGIV